MITPAPTILIVDDDLPTLLLLRRMLLPLAPHAEIIPTNDGAAALAVLVERPVSLVITDYKMPGMNGVQLARAIKAASPATRVAIITVHDVYLIAREARALGVEYVLPKPFVPLQIKQMIDESIPFQERDQGGHYGRPNDSGY
jgi:CheY-like chemotaxis protein